MRTLILLTALAGAAIFGIALLAPRMFEPDTARAVVVASLVCIGAAIPALSIPLILIPAKPEWLVEAGMGAMVTRMLLTMIAGWVAYRNVDMPQGAFLNAMLGFYLTLLTLETAVTWRIASRHWRQPGVS